MERVTRGFNQSTQSGQVQGIQGNLGDSKSNYKMWALTRLGKNYIVYKAISLILLEEPFGRSALNQLDKDTSVNSFLNAWCKRYRIENVHRTNRSNQRTNPRKSGWYCSMDEEVFQRNEKFRAANWISHCGLRDRSYNDCMRLTSLRAPHEICLFVQDVSFVSL